MSKIRALNRSRGMSRLTLLVILAALPFYSNSAPIAVFGTAELTITLDDDECAFKAQVTNLPKRAIWNENGNIVEGCFGVNQQLGIVNFYFADKTVASIPVQYFHRVRGA